MAGIITSHTGIQETLVQWRL